MKFAKSAWLVAALLLVAAPLRAQTITATNKTLTTAGADCSTATNCAVASDLRGVASIGVYIDVGTSGTFNFEGTVDGANWFAVSDDVNASSSLTADGARFFSNPGYRQFRVRASAISGAATVNITKGEATLRSTATLSGAAQGDGALQDGANSAIEATVFDLTNSNPLTVAITDATGNQITSFGGGTQYAVDTALGATPTGTLSLVIRDDSLSTLTPVEGDAVALRVDQLGALWTTISGNVTVIGTGTFATQAAATQSGTWNIRNQDGAGNALTSAVRGSERALSVQIVDASGAQITSFSGGSGGSGDTELPAAALLADGTANPTVPGVAAYNMCLNGSTWDRCTVSTLTEATHDGALTPGSTKASPLMGRASSSAPSAVSANDDAVLAWFTTSGALNIADGGGSITVDGSITCSNCSGTGVSVNEDVASASADPGTPAYGIRADTLSTTTSANGDYQPLKGDVNGALWVNPFSTTPAATTYLSVRLTDGSSFLSGSNDYTHDGALTASTTTGPAQMFIAKDFDGAALPNVVSAEGDATLGASSLYGVQYVMVVSEDGALERGTSTTPFVVGDGSGALNVICDSGCAGGTQFAEDVASANADIGTLSMARRTATPANTSGTDGDYEVLQMSAGRLWTSTVLTDGTDTALIDGSGNLAVTCSNCSGSGVSVNEDVASADGNPGTPAMMVRKATPANSSGTDGDYEFLQGSAGRLWVDASGVTLTVAAHAVTNAGTFVTQENGAALTSLQLADDVVFAEDVAHTTGDKGDFVLGRRIDTIAASSGTSGDYEAFNMNGSGALWVAPTAATNGGATPGYYISAASNNSTNVKASAGQVYYLTVINTTATLKYIRLYDSGSAPTCTSGTGVVFYAPIPANSTTGAGFALPISVGAQFANGIGFCITGGAGVTDNTSTAAGDVIVSYGTK